jgi:lysophospholipase L1-like esterase
MLLEPASRRLLGMALGGWILTACHVGPGGSAPRARGHDAIRIVALGDSTTEAGWEGNAKSVYPERLERALEARGIDIEMINAGISNTTSRQAVERLDSDVRRFDPDYVIIQFGINDSWIDASEGRTQPRLTPDEFADCLTTLITTLRADGAKPILMTPNPMRWSAMYGDELRDPALGFDFDDPRGINRLLDVYVQRVRDVAREQNVPLVDVSERFEAYDRVPGQSIDDLLIDGDELHPSDAGHALIAEWLTEILLSDRAGD